MSISSDLRVNFVKVLLQYEFYFILSVDIWKMCCFKREENEFLEVKIYLNTALNRDHFTQTCMEKIRAVYYYCKAH